MNCRGEYFDHAVAVKMSQIATKAMLPYREGIYGNPSSPHSGEKSGNQVTLVSARARIGCETK